MVNEEVIEQNSKKESTGGRILKFKLNFFSKKEGSGKTEQGVAPVVEPIVYVNKHHYNESPDARRRVGISERTEEERMIIRQNMKDMLRQQNADALGLW